MVQKLLRSIGGLAALALLLPVTVWAAPVYQEVTCAQDYVVQAGDSLSQIATRFYGDNVPYTAIFEATNAAAAAGEDYDTLADANTVEVGQTLCLPEAPTAGVGVITIADARFFPEGVTRAADGSIYVGSMEEGTIYKAAPGATTAEPFIEAGANGLVSTLGLLADDARGILWACSSDADNAKLSGSAPVAVKAFDLVSGEAKGSYDFPGGGFCNDLTLDAAGNLYASDSWSPRILRLAAGGSALEEWLNEPQLGAEQWSLNGLDIDQANGLLYLVNIATGQLFRIPIAADGSAGAVTEIKTSQPLQRPDGLKVIDATTLAVAESVPGGMSVLSLSGDEAQVRVVNQGLDGVATFALHNGSAWLVENQGDHFWDPTNAGPEATPPFRIVEIPLNLGAAVTETNSNSAIILPGERFFPEGVTVAQDGTLYAGSMEEGSIVRILPGATAAEPFIAAGANGLVSVLGVYADEASGTLWACSSDAGNSKLTGSAPVGVKAFDLQTGEAKGSYDFPGGGFCNDLTVDAAGNLYATDSWSSRILRLAAGGTELEEWINDPQLGPDQWSLNGIDVDNENSFIYVVNQLKGQLFRIELQQDGSAGAVTEIITSQPLRRPDGLKLVGPNILAAAEGGAGGMALIRLSGITAEVTVVSEGLDGVATFAFYNGSAWLVENQGDHFWDPTNAGPDATPPFRLVEIPLGL